MPVIPMTDQYLPIVQLLAQGLASGQALAERRSQLAYQRAYQTELLNQRQQEAGRQQEALNLRKEEAVRQQQVLDIQKANEARQNDLLTIQQKQEQRTEENYPMIKAMDRQNLSTRQLQALMPVVQALVDQKGKLSPEDIAYLHKVGGEFADPDQIDALVANIEQSGVARTAVKNQFDALDKALKSGNRDKIEEELQTTHKVIAQTVGQIPASETSALQQQATSLTPKDITDAQFAANLPKLTEGIPDLEYRQFASTAIALTRRYYPQMSQQDALNTYLLWYNDYVSGAREAGQTPATPRLYENFLKASKSSPVGTTPETLGQPPQQPQGQVQVQQPLQQTLQQSQQNPTPKANPFQSPNYYY